jgi:ribosomal protein L11 methyltransferase
VIRLALRVPRTQAERVLAELLELAPAGVEEVDVDPETVEYAVYGAPGELPQLPDLEAAAGGALVELSTREVAEDWAERWKAFHRPILVRSRARTLRVRPPWEPPLPAGEAEQEIAIDPGQAFGTGAHATTRLCLELLLELAEGQAVGRPLLDLGTGSGVLAIAAAKLGFAPVLALDLERESVQAARANATANDVELEVRRYDLRTEPLPPSDGRALGETVILANLLRPLLLELAERLPTAPAQLIASGLLAEEADELAEAFLGRLGLRERERRLHGEWAALLLSP